MERSRKAVPINDSPAVFLSSQSSIELNISHLKPMSFHQLVIDHSLSAQKQNKSATCGLLFMKEGLRKIQDHLKTLIASERFEHLDKQFKNVITRLDKHITPCARHVLAECDHHKAPEFPETDFIAKSWIRRFLESSVKFLDQVNHLLGKSKNHEQH